MSAMLLKLRVEARRVPLATIHTAVASFFVGAGIGWLWEVFYIWANTGLISNRGTLHGPWLPIYGFGCLIMMGLKYLYGSRPRIYFGMSILTFGLFEYTTGWVLELMFQTRWWDYSNELFNIHGRVCLKGLLFFALAGMLFAYVIEPALRKVLAKVPQKVLTVVCTVAVALFFTDLLYSARFPNMGLGITEG